MKINSDEVSVLCFLLQIRHCMVGAFDTRKYNESEKCLVTSDIFTKIEQKKPNHNIEDCIIYSEYVYIIM